MTDPADEPSPPLKSWDFTDHETRNLQRVSTWVDSADSTVRPLRWLWRAIAFVGRLLGSCIRWFIDWWPKLWKALVTLPPLLWSLEQMGIPVVAGIRTWIERLLQLSGGAS